MSCQRITHHPLGYLHHQGQWASFPCRVRSGALLAHYIARLLRQDRVISLPRPGDDHFHSVGAQRDPIVPSSALLVPPASSPYLDANAGIGPRVTKTPYCSTLQLCQTNQTWGGEPSELLVAKGY